MNYRVSFVSQAVVKYCKEHVCECLCVCVCLSVYVSESVSPEPYARSLPNYLCMFPMATAQSFGGVTQSQGEWAIWGVSSPLTMHCTAYSISDPYKNG